MREAERKRKKERERYDSLPVRIVVVFLSSSVCLPPASGANVLGTSGKGLSHWKFKHMHAAIVNSGCSSYSCVCFSPMTAPLASLNINEAGNSIYDIRTPLIPELS